MTPAVRFDLDPGLEGGVRAWQIGVDGVRVVDGGRAYAYLVALAADLQQRWAGCTAGQVDGIADARRLYRRYGTDPTRTRPSSEALLRRALRGVPLYRINEVVDVGNWCSLEYLLPLGLYDRDRIEGERVRVRLGEPEEEYEGIRKGPVHLAGRLCVADARGAFGSPTSDSLRTSVRESTTRLAAIVFAPVECDPARVEACGRALAERLARFAGGTVVLDEPVPLNAPGAGSRVPPLRRSD